MLSTHLSAFWKIFVSLKETERTKFIDRRQSPPSKTAHPPPLLRPPEATYKQSYQSSSLRSSKENYQTSDSQSDSDVSSGSRRARRIRSLRGSSRGGSSRGGRRRLSLRSLRRSCRGSSGGSADGLSLRLMREKASKVKIRWEWVCVRV